MNTQAFVIFIATFCVVFALGFQSLTVNRGQYTLAFFNSFLISAAQLAILKFVPDAHGVGEYLAYMTGGPLGIITSMWAHRKLFYRKPEVQPEIDDNAHLGIG